MQVTSTAMSPSSVSQTPALGLRGIEKRFVGVRALHGVDLDLHRGEIHALLGENGAGKSTLIKVICGISSTDGGTVERAGALVSIASPQDARRLGISLVPQDILIVPNLTIGRNMLLGIERRGACRGRLSQEELRLTTEALIRVGASFDPETPTRDLGVPQLRLAQIARALIEAGEIMILDEPTAVLSEPDADHLHERLLQFRDEGHAILYVTHRLSEVMRLADRVTVLRNGARAGTFARGAFSRDEIVQLMTKLPAASSPRRNAAPRLTPMPSALRMTARALCARGFKKIDLNVSPGRIVGIAGVQGSGHGDLVRALAGIDPIESGTITLDGRPLKGGAIRDAVGRGVLLVPADRRGAAIVPGLSLRANLALSGRIRPCVRRFGLRHLKQERLMALGYIERLAIRTPSSEALVATLSGGNQQKVALARALEGEARVLFVEEPTQGVDLGAKAEIHALLRRLADERDCAVVVASSEFEELLDLAEEIHVMCNGRIVETMPGHDATYQKILNSALP